MNDDTLRSQAQEASREDAFQLDSPWARNAPQEPVQADGARLLEMNGSIYLIDGAGTTGAILGEPVLNDPTRLTARPITGLPVAGYKRTQPDWAIALVNENKILEEEILRQIDKHLQNPDVTPREASLARTKVQEAFMWLNRAVFQPGRVALPGDVA